MKRVGGAHLGLYKSDHVGKSPEMGYPFLLKGDGVRWGANFLKSVCIEVHFLKTC